jgi:hypothetical protein
MSALSHYAEFCGPTAIASAMRRFRYDVTRELFAGHSLDADGGTSFDAFASYLGVEYHPQPKWYPHRSGTRRYPTVTQWLREHPVGSYVLHTTSVEAHVLHVEDGEVRADARPGGSLRARVEGFWPVRWGAA